MSAESASTPRSQREQVLHLLTAEQALTSLRGDRQSTLLERALIAPELRTGRRKEGDAAGSERHDRAVFVTNAKIADETHAEVGDGFGLGVTDLGGPRAGRHFYRDPRHARQIMVGAIRASARVARSQAVRRQTKGRAKQRLIYARIAGRERKLAVT